MKTNTTIEPLESRIAPASVLTYTDIDGDKVTITASSGDLAGKATFDPMVAVERQLVLLDLTASDFQGADITFTVVKAGNGDGLAAVGEINAAGRDLGKVTVKGDLGDIDCGDTNTATPALELLSVRSMGRYGFLTQPAAADLVSDIKGALGGLKVAADIKDAQILVTADVNADAKIGSITIGGSLIGGAADNSGLISGEGDIGPVKIGRDLIGGDGNGSGWILSTTRVGAVTIGGSLVGGAGNNSGSILGNNGGIGAVKIGGNVVGGLGDTSGRVAAFGQPISSVSIDGSLLGGAGNNSGEIYSNNGIGMVKISHDVVGSTGDFSGSISSDGSLGTIAIAGSLLGGGGESSAAIIAVDGMGAVTIGHDVKGGSGDDSARIESGGALGAVTIGGSLIGGSGPGAGSISGASSIGAVKIGHDILGGSASFTALIATDGPLASVTVGGSLIGGTGIDSGSINSEGSLGPVKIGHDVKGGSASGSGKIRSSGALASATIGGSVFGGSGNASGVIIASGAIGTVKIGHDLVGGSITGLDLDLIFSGAIFADRIASVTIGGSIIAGADASTAGNIAHSATIRAADDIGSVTVKGGLIGNVTPNGNSFATISARGQATPGATSDVAIGKISIGGRVEFAQIFAGYTAGLIRSNADAQIGSVTVGADWIASSIVAGAFNTGADVAPSDDNIDFGNAFDAKITGGTDDGNRFSKIGSIAIAGQIFGQPGSSPNFGFVSEEIGALKVGGVAFTLTAGRGNDGRNIGPSPDVALHEIGATITSPPLVLVPAAKLVNASTVTYTDFDGDHVTVRLSRPLLTDTTIANDVFKFDTGDVGGANTEPQQLQLIDLRLLATNGVGVTVTVAPGGGDRLANIGAILSTGFDLGTVTIPGDLGQIDAGDAVAATKGLTALNLRTFGRLGLDTQPVAFAGFVPFVGGDILGGLGALTVKQDIAGASLSITGALGALTIGGSLIGGSATTSGIFTPQAIGAVKIGHHLQGGRSGSIRTDATIASLTVGGSIIGGEGTSSGLILADGGGLGAVKIGHNVLGGIGTASGTVLGTVASANVGGSLVGGIGTRSGKFFNGGTGTIGAVRIGHNVVGGAGDDSGKIDSAGKLTSVTIGGSLLGGSGDQDTLAHRGQIFAGSDLGAVIIGHNAHGGAGDFSAGIQSDEALASLTIGGSLIGGSGFFSGYAEADDDMGAVKIGRNLLGGSGGAAGYIEGFDSIGGVTIGGSLVGGAETFDGGIFTAFALGPVKIGHDMHGGATADAGSIKGQTSIASVTLGGSLVGGSSVRTGAIIGGDIGAVKIGRDLIGGSIAGATGNLDATGYLEGSGRIASVSIGGSIIAGFDDSTNGALTKNASIRAGGDLGALSVKGSLIGNVGDGTAANLSKVIISASGQATLAANATLDLAIKSISIGGRVERAQILAGYSTALGVDGPGSIGPVRVGGDWIASDLVAGAMFDDDPTAPNLFGDFDDIPITQPGTAIVARIASITIKGVVVGTAAPGNDHFGFVSHVIGSFKSLGFTAPLTNNVIRDVIELSPITGDVTIREV